jgi:hypothetical protein
VTYAQAAWESIKRTIAEHGATAVAVSPELYFEQVEFVQEVNSAYVPTAPEFPRMPWLAIDGVPVVVDPSLDERQFALVTTRDFIDDMRLALDIYTDGMLDSKSIKHEVTYDD